MFALNNIKTLKAGENEDNKKKWALRALNFAKSNLQ